MPKGGVRDEKNGSGREGCKNLRTGMLSSRLAPPAGPPPLPACIPPALPVLEPPPPAPEEEIGIRTAWNQPRNVLNGPPNSPRARWYERATFSATAPEGLFEEAGEWEDEEPKKTGL